MAFQQGKAWEFANHVAHLILQNKGMIYGNFVIQSIISQSTPDIDPPSAIQMTITYDDMIRLLRDCRSNHLIAYAEQESNEEIVNNVGVMKYHVGLDNMYWKQVASKYPISLDLSEIEEQCRSVAALQLVVTHTYEECDEPSEETLDFECNSLFVTSSGFHVSSQVEIKNGDIMGKYKEVTRIMEDLNKKKTRLMYSCGVDMAEKGRKLMNDGWTIYDDAITTVTSTDDAELCILCHDKLPVHHFKMYCCNARYHGKCLKDCIDHGFTTKCTMCRSDAFLDDQHYVLLDTGSDTGSMVVEAR